MSAVEGRVLGHLVRRGVHIAQVHFAGPQFAGNDEYMQQLNADAMLYEQQGPEAEINPAEMLPIFITAIITLVLMLAIRYTVGEVVSTLTMIETPTTTAVVEDKPPAYADEPDAPLEKDAPLLPSEAEADLEVMLIRHKPITAKISSTVSHLTRAGGFTARFKGAGWSLVYHALHSSCLRLIAGFFPYTLVAQALISVVVTVALSTTHMTWTHSIIVAPSSKPWYRRRVSCKNLKALLLPSLVYALAQQATFFLPMYVASGLANVDYDHVVRAYGQKDCSRLIYMGLTAILPPLTALFVAFALLLPATVTLTRIEAALLPSDVETVVTFDREVVLGGLDLSKRGNCKKLFLQAWLTFDYASRVRILKLYAKLVALQIGIAFVAVHVMLAEFYFIGGERLAIFLKSGIAQLKLAAIEAQENAAN